MNETVLKVGITGQSGFIGTHLYNFLGLKQNIERIRFKDAFFSNQDQLNGFVRRCDVIVHLAAINRHKDENILFNSNIDLVKKIISACEDVNHHPKILFSSSIQEKTDTTYGKSKSEGRKLFETWASKNNADFSALIIPNVFGPFGKPYYNSVVATFCHQIAHNEAPKVHIDNTVELISINSLLSEIYNCIFDLNCPSKYIVPCSKRIKVTELLEILNGFRNNYMNQNIIPDLSDVFIRDLFNTFRCYLPDDYFPVAYIKNEDNRGSFVELVKANTPGQFSYSTTRPGISRGNHFHTRKAERFSVISGKAIIRIRRIGTEKIIEYKLDGETPSFVDMPVWCSHNITNIGTDQLITVFWINEPYNSNDPDTYFEKV